MIKFVDNFLNNITMYRLVLYCLIFLLVIASFLNSFDILFSALVLVVISLATNRLFSYVFEAPANFESVYITALILALIITPIKTVSDIWFLGWVAVLAISSKYILSINYKHIFNPAAIAVVITGFALNHSASWWIGTRNILPFVVLISFLIIRKIKRFDLALSFIASTLITIFIVSFFSNLNPLTQIQKLILDSPLIFFAGVMLTEPLTTPPTHFLRILYGILVGFLFVPQVHLGSIYLTPEWALIIGNLFSYLISPKQKLLLRLKQKNKLTPDTYDFVFKPQVSLNYLPGQYLEWTLDSDKPDSRGNRRYFTLASSPTEDDIRIGVKFNSKSSSFKKDLLNLDSKKLIIASQLAGDFTLPSDSRTKLVFIAGGIGITPFRSMIKYLLDSNQNRDIVLFYSVKSESDLVYQDIFEQAQKKMKLKFIQLITSKTGRLNEDVIKMEVPDYLDSKFYLSGPKTMIDSYKQVLASLNIPKKNIITDYFPGFA